MNKKKVILLILVVSIIISSGFLVRDFYITNNFSVVSEVDKEDDLIDSNDATNEILKLQNTYNNQDIKGIVAVDLEESFRFPIAQSKDNDFYLTHDYYKNYDKYGSIYADYRVDLDNSRKILLFGHNSSYIDTPFGSLENYYSKDYYDKHKYIYITTQKNIYKYEIFSVYVETSDFTYMNINFSNDEEWYSHILKLQSKSMYEIDSNLSKNDNILIMQTCSNNQEYKNYAKKYLLVISKRIDNN